MNGKNQADHLELYKADTTAHVFFKKGVVSVQWTGIIRVCCSELIEEAHH